MSAPTPPPVDAPGSAITDGLRRVQLSVLIALAVCAVAILVQERVDPEPAPHRTYTVWAVGMAFASIAGRLLATSPVAALRTRAAASLVSLLAVGGIGVVAVLIAASQGAVWTSLAYTTGAAILALRRPTDLGAAAGERRVP